MSKLRNPDSREQRAVSAARKKLAKIPLKDTETKINHILYETADLCIGYIAQELRHAYCNSEKLLMVPQHLAEPIKTKAVEIFILKNQSLNRKVQRLYQLTGIEPSSQQ